MGWIFRDVAAVPAGLRCELEMTADSGSPYGVMSRGNGLTWGLV